MLSQDTSFQRSAGSVSLKTARQRRMWKIISMRAKVKPTYYRLEPDDHSEFCNDIFGEG